MRPAFKCSLRAALALAAALPVSAQSWRSVDCPGAVATALTGVSDNLRMVGVTISSDGRYHGIIYSNGVCVSLDRAGVYSMIPMAVNNSGQIAGSFYLSASEQAANMEHAFLQTGTTFEELVPQGTAPREVSANGIDNAGTVVGSLTYSGGSGRGFIRKSDGTWSMPSGPLPPQDGFEFLDINESGWIAGLASVSPTPGSDAVAFVRSPTGVYETVRYGNKPKTELIGLNEGREMVGRFYEGATDEPPAAGTGFYRDRSGNMTPIAAPVPNLARLHPMKINGSGWITGYWIDTGGTMHGVLMQLSTPVSKAGVFRGGFLWLQDVDGDRSFTTPPDRVFAFGGIAGDIPICGDWNAGGREKAGIYRPANGLFILDYDGDGAFDPAIDKAFNLGVGQQPGDVPVVGDWNGSGVSKVGLFRAGFLWILDSNGNGVFEQGVDQAIAFGGVAGDVPVVGDWDGDGTSSLGLFRLGFFWILDANGNGQLDNVNQPGGDRAFAFGGVPGDVPVTGKWWGGDLRANVGVFRAGFFWVLDANGNTTFDGAAGGDLAFPFGGIAGDKPVAGKW